MSGINQPEEELIDYEDDHDVGLTTGGSGAAAAAPADGEKEKKTYANVHTTGFRYVHYLASQHTSTNCPTGTFS